MEVPEPKWKVECFHCNENVLLPYQEYLFIINLASCPFFFFFFGQEDFCYQEYCCNRSNRSILTTLRTLLPNRWKRLATRILCLSAFPLTWQATCCASATSTGIADDARMFSRHYSTQLPTVVSTQINQFTFHRRYKCQYGPLRGEGIKPLAR